MQADSEAETLKKVLDPFRTHQKSWRVSCQNLARFTPLDITAVRQVEKDPDILAPHRSAEIPDLPIGPAVMNVVFTFFLWLRAGPIVVFGEI